MNQSLLFAFGLAAAALFLVTNLWLLLRVVRPLRLLSEQTKRLAGGDFAALQQGVNGVPEIEAIRHSMASMAQHVRRTHEDSAVIRHALTGGLESERQRIAHELHDDTVQTLVAIAQSIDLATQWTEKDPERAAQLLRGAREQAVESIGGLRRLIANLRPPALEELGLVPALRMLGQDETPVSIRVEASGIERRLDDTLELTLFRVAQEAVYNACRHGQAKGISITADFGADKVTLAVQDDGRGFSPPEQLASLAPNAHYGLLGMQERVEALRGKLLVSSAPGRGTEIRAIVPVDRVEQPETSVRDPVCGAPIQPEQAFGKVVHEGHDYYFCCPVCQGAFQKDPGLYLTSNFKQKVIDDRPGMSSD